MNNPKNVELKIRVNDKMNDYLEALCETWGFNKSQAIRWCIQTTMLNQQKAYELSKDVLSEYVQTMPGQVTLGEVLK